MCDLAGACDTATVILTVNAINDPPTAADDFANVDQDTSTDIDVQVNDGDVDGDLLDHRADLDPCSTVRRR